jgi:hypothetical protein
VRHHYEVLFPSPQDPYIFLNLKLCFLDKKVMLAEEKELSLLHSYFYAVKGNKWETIEH